MMLLIMELILRIVLIFQFMLKKLGTAIQNGEVDLGIAICGTGIGMSITFK